MSTRDLRPVGPIDMLDRALLVARRGGFARAGRAWLGGAVPAGVLAGIYYLERVEGVRGLRIFSGNEINLPKSRETSDRQIVRMSDRHADDE
mgnify:CR=1 FL=1